eukprot:gene6525-6753_t
MDLPHGSAQDDESLEQSAADCGRKGSLSKAASLGLLPPQLVATAADISRTVATVRRSLDVVQEDLRGEQQAGDEGGEVLHPATQQQQQEAAAGMTGGADAEGVAVAGEAVLAPEAVWRVERNILNQHFKGVTIYCGWN